MDLISSEKVRSLFFIILTALAQLVERLLGHLEVLHELFVRQVLLPQSVLDAFVLLVALEVRVRECVSRWVEEAIKW